MKGRIQEVFLKFFNNEREDIFPHIYVNFSGNNS